jgi:RNA polymerase sigma-70 factor (ECF subfamily)
MEVLGARALGRARTVARVMLNDREAALDVAQDAVIDALEGLSKLRDPRQFDAWVTTITSRRVLRAQRETTRHRSVLRLADPQHGETLAAPDVDLLGGVRADEVRSALYAALPSLTPDQRVAIVLRYLCDFSEAQIADALGKRVGATSAILSRARAVLIDHPSIAALAPKKNEP